MITLSVVVGLCIYLAIINNSFLFIGVALFAIYLNWALTPKKVTRDNTGIYDETGPNGLPVKDKRYHGKWAGKNRG